MRRGGLRSHVRRGVTAGAPALAAFAIAATLALAVPRAERLPETSPLASRLIGSGQIRDGSILLKDVKRGQLEKRFVTISGAAAKYLKIDTAALRYLKVADAEATYLKIDDAAHKYLKIDDAASTYIGLDQAVDMFLKISDADLKYLKVEDAVQKYLKIEDADVKYLKISEADAYLKIEDADVKYLKVDDAVEKYLKIEDADVKYLKISEADAYLKIEDAAHKYLSLDAAADLLKVGDADARYIKLGDGILGSGEVFTGFQDISLDGGEPETVMTLPGLLDVAAQGKGQEGTEAILIALTPVPIRGKATVTDAEGNVSLHDVALGEEGDQAVLPLGAGGQATIQLLHPEGQVVTVTLTGMLVQGESPHVAVFGQALAGRAGKP